MGFSACEEQVIETLLAKVHENDLQFDIDRRCIGIMQERNLEVA
jgi:hypothetical protein